MLKIILHFCLILSINPPLSDTLDLEKENNSTFFTSRSVHDQKMKLSSHILNTVLGPELRCVACMCVMMDSLRVQQGRGQVLLEQAKRKHGARLESQPSFKRLISSSKLSSAAVCKVSRTHIFASISVTTVA